jgi:hypothetical protein
MAVTIDGSAGVTTNAGGSVNPSTTIDGINYSCRAWVNFNGTGTVAIRGSANVSSITDVATGQYAVNFSTTIVDANYCTNVTGTHQSGVYVAWGAISNATPPTTSAVRVDFNANGGALTDVQFAQVSIMR